MRGRDLCAGEGGERVEAPRNAPGDSAHDPHREDDDERVGDRRQDLADEDLAATARAREDRFQRPVLALGRDDVTGDERRDEREAPDRHEEEDDERRCQTGVADVAAERNVVRATRLEHEDDDEDERHGHRTDETEVGALLREELRDLPAVHLCDGSRHATAARS